MKNIRKRKMIFTNNRITDGAIYRKGNITFGKNVLEDFGITEDNPEVYVIEDYVNKCLIIKAI